jgi:hypothetical protein
MGCSGKNIILENYYLSMSLKLISRRFVIIGTIMIWSIKFLIRPYHLWDEAGFFFGIAPNLLGSFLIPYAAYWLFSGRDFLLARIFRIQTNYDLRLVCILGFGMLIVNEYLQLISIFGRTFDYYDIASSLAGLGASYFIFGKAHQKQWMHAN